MSNEIRCWLAYANNQLQTTIHKFWVAYYIMIFCTKLLWRAVVHDLSKYGNTEALVFARHVHELKKIQYGTPEYGAMLNKLPCLQHHYTHNSHHPQHYPNGFRDMSALDRVEMVADWCAAVRRNKNGCIWKSLALNQSRFGYDDRDREWLTLMAVAIKGDPSESHMLPPVQDQPLPPDATSLASKAV